MIKQDYKWQGRVDTEDTEFSRRFHQHVVLDHQQKDFHCAPVFFGIECDAGVSRNQGVAGSVDGPNAIRAAIANLACRADQTFFDVGNIRCVDDNLEQVQQESANEITQILERNGLPLILGGGHEIGWSSYLGAQQFLQTHAPGKKLGILNFDAHFDMRNPEPQPSSGTPFRQGQEWCQHHGVSFNYFVMGLNPSANTEALFSFAKRTHVQWVEDIDFTMSNIAQLQLRLADWVDGVDYVYVTLDLDVFSAAYAPGVSATAAVGVEPAVVLKLLQFLRSELKVQKKSILLADVAEMNPSKDIDNRTAKLAARYLYQLIS